MSDIAITIRPPRPDELQAVRQLRYEVLDADIGLPLKTHSARDDDPSSIHMAAFKGNQVISTVRFDRLPGSPPSYLVRRMATDPGYRGQGIGSWVLAAAEQEAQRRGARRLVLDARQATVGFYERAGYRVTGERVVHDGHTNISMTKPVSVLR